MGSPEPWALVLAPTVTSLGSCVKWLPGAGALLSFPALKFENVFSPPEGGWSLIPASCWLPWSGFPSVCLPHSQSWNHGFYKPAGSHYMARWPSGHCLAGFPPSGVRLRPLGSVEGEE